MLRPTRHMTSLAESLIGRDAELELLEGLLDEARGGTSRLAMLSGEPGIGKTSVVAELERRAEARGWLSLQGRASELERELPFGLVVDAFDAYLESLDARAYDRLAADGLGELASVFPSLRALRSDAEPPRTPVERFRAHHAVRELIERLAAKQPLLLGLDDLHWSDGASLELIAHLLRRPPHAAVMVVGTFRAGQADAGFTATIEAAARDGQVRSVALGALDRAASERLIEFHGLAEREGLFRESGGNPFYLLQLARSGGPVALDGGRRPGGVPAAVTAAIAGELDHLEPNVRAFAQAAAVAGDPFELDLAVAAAALPEADALDVLDELVARDLIRAGEVPRRFQFRHPLVRSAVYESCAPGARLVAHQRCAEALAARGAPATARAHHVEQSARHGDAAAIAVLREAGEAAAGRAPTSAVRWFEAALRLLPDTAPREERAGLLVALAGSSGATGRFEHSRSALLRTLDLTPAEDAGTRVGLISACAAIEHLQGRHTQAHDRLAGALAQLPDRETPEGAALMLQLGVDAFYGMDWAGMLEWGEAALATARALDDGPLRAVTGALAAFAATLRPETIAAAWRHYNEVAAVVDALSDAELAQQLGAMAWLAPAEFYLDVYGPGMVHAERGLALARSTGQGDLFPGLMQGLANIMFVTGRPREAAELLDGVVESARLADSGISLAWSLLNRSFAASCAGETNDALRASAEAMSLTEGLDASPVVAWSGGVHARALLDAGDAPRAYETFLRTCGGDELPLIPGAWRAIWLDFMTRCHLRLGRLDDARRASALAEGLAGAYGLPLSTAIAHRSAASVALEAGDAATAAERALAAAAGAGEVGARIEAADARVLAGRALARLGETDRAVAELEQAATEFDACGAHRRREPVEHELRKLGHGAYRRTRPGRPDEKGVGSLTGRELEVARLVVDRRTNQEIAEELFLSIKTVETHMRNIFRKLDASSRVDVARTVERAEAG